MTKSFHKQQKNVHFAIIFILCRTNLVRWSLGEQTWADKTGTARLLYVGCSCVIATIPYMSFIEALGIINRTTGESKSNAASFRVLINMQSKVHSPEISMEPGGFFHPDAPQMEHRDC